MTSLRSRRLNHERAKPTNSSERARAALFVSRACDPLAGRVLVYLFDAYGTGVLVSVAFLDGDRAGWRNIIAPTASVGRTDLRGGNVFDVPDVAQADEEV